MTGETAWRSLVKTVTYRILGSSITFTIAYAMTGSWQISGSISIIELIIKPAGYWAHERVWNRIPGGKVVHRNHN